MFISYINLKKKNPNKGVPRCPRKWVLYVDSVDNLVHAHTQKVGVCGIKIGMHWDLVNNEQRQTLEEALHQSAKLYKQSLCALTAFILWRVSALFGMSLETEVAWYNSVCVRASLCERKRMRDGESVCLHITAER